MDFWLWLFSWTFSEFISFASFVFIFLLLINLLLIVVFLINLDDQT